MTRNTVKRVEVAAPVLSDKLKKRICNMFEVLMADNVKSRIMSKNGRYSKKKDDVCEPLNAQEYFYDEAYKNARAKAERKLKNAARKKKSAPKTKKSKNKGK
jgi:polyphosphate kinase